MDDENGPRAAFYSARQALALVAYGDPGALDGNPPGMPDMAGQWGIVDGSFQAGRRTRLLMLMRWVWARTRWRLTRDRRTGTLRRCSLPPLGAKQRAEVR